MSVLHGLLDRLSVGKSGDRHAILGCWLRVIVGEIIASGCGSFDGGRIGLDRITAVTAGPDSNQRTIWGVCNGRERQDLSESLALPWAFFRLGGGIRHSMLKATQFVHGTPRLAASQRTCHLKSMVATGPARMRMMPTFRPWQVYSFLSVSINVLTEGRGRAEQRGSRDCRGGHARMD